MTAAAFDTLAYAEELQKAGLPEAHAKAHAKALAEALSSGIAALATKADVDALRTALKADLESLRLSTQADLQAVKVDLQKEIAATKADLRTAKADLQADIEKMGRLVIMWHVGTLLAAVGVVFAIARYLAP